MSTSKILKSFLPALWLFLAISLPAGEILSEELGWMIYNSKCEGAMEYLPDGGGYRLTKQPGGDGVYFFNEHGVPATPGARYRVSIRLASCDATISPELMVNFPGTPDASRGQYSTDIHGNAAQLEFTARNGDRIRANCIIRGDGEAVVKSIDIEQLPSGNEPAPKTGGKRNLLGQGSGFEVGPHGMNAYHAESWWFGWIDPAIQPAFDDTTAHSGRYSLRFTAQDYSKVALHETHNRVWFCPIQLDKDKTYTVSAWMKADRQNFFASLSCAEYEGQSKTFAVDTEWRRYTLTFKPDFPRRKENYCRIFVNVGSSMLDGTLWVDDVQLEEGDTATDYEGEPVEFGAALESPGDKLLLKSRLGDYSFTLRFRNNTGADVERSVKYTIKDYWDKERAAGDVAAVIPANGNHLENLPVPALPCGYYRAYFTTADDELYDEIIFGIYEPMQYQEKLPKDWPLGCHDSGCEPILRALGFGWVRPFHDFSMKKIVPEPDVVTFANADKIMARADAAKLNLMPILGPDFFSNDYLYGSIPKWAVEERTDDAHAASHERAAFPKLDAWRKYVRELARHYKGRIPAWEVFNEPDGWGIKPEKYLVYMQAAYEEAKKEDPDCWIVAGSTTSDFGQIPLPWTRAIMEKDGYRHFDAISVHMYSNKMPERTLDGAENFLGKIRDGLKAHGRDIPVWHTEKSHSIMELGYSRRKFAVPNSYSSTPGYRVNSFRDRAEYLMREAIIDSTVGKGPCFWFADVTAETHIAAKTISGFDPFWLWHTEYDGSPSPELLAANGLARMIDGPMTPVELIKLSDSVYCGFYEGTDSAVAALWNIKGQGELQLPKAASGFRRFDFFGEPLATPANGALVIDTAPVYLRANGMDAAAMKQIVQQFTMGASEFQIYGGLELTGDEGLVLAIYADNGGIGGQAAIAAITDTPKGWIMAADQQQAVSRKFETTRMAFPITEYANSNAANTFMVAVNDASPVAIVIPPFDSTAAFAVPPSSQAEALRATAPKAIDGRPDDWPNAPAAYAMLPEQVKYGIESWTHPAEISCEARFAWDDDFLYAFFRVHDNAVVRFASPSDAWMSDCVELFIGLDPDAPGHKPAHSAVMTPTDLQIFLAPGTPHGPYRQATAAVAGRPGQCPWRVVSQITDGGYLLEAAIPWRDLAAGFKPRSGMKLLMSFQAADTDDAGTAALRKIFWAGNNSNYNSPLNWGTMILK